MTYIATHKGVLGYDRDDGTHLSNGRELFQLVDDTILPEYNKGVVAAIRALCYGSDDRDVFTWDEARWFILDPVIKRYPNSFKKGGNLPNESAVLSVLAKLQVVRRVSNATTHECLDVDEGIAILSNIIDWMARPIYRDGKEAYRVKRYRIPHWLFTWDEDRADLPRKTAAYLHAVRRKVAVNRDSSILTY